MNKGRSADECTGQDDGAAGSELSTFLFCFCCG